MFTDLTYWYDHHGRDLPWRRPGTSPWSILVCEVMSQQTPVARVIPAWTAWMERWPTPAHLAQAETADVLRAWDRLGYPRRALRLRECAATIVERHGGDVPTTESELLALPGIGQYTAAALLAFAFQRRSVVLDTNTRRVLARLHGDALPPPSLTTSERERAATFVPDDDDAAAAWNTALMELGALVCTASLPRCEACPLAQHCEWLAAGRPADRFAHRRRTQTFEGTLRQARGKVMALLRDSDGPVTRDEALAEASTDADQAHEALQTLAADGLVSVDEAIVSLPS